MKKWRKYSKIIRIRVQFGFIRIFLPLFLFASCNVFFIFLFYGDATRKSSRCLLDVAVYFNFALFLRKSRHRIRSFRFKNGESVVYFVTHLLVCFSGNCYRNSGLLDRICVKLWLELN